MDELKIFKTEAVLLKEKKRKKNVSLLDDTGLTGHRIGINKIIRNECDHLGDVVSVHKYPTVLIGNLVHILPFEDSIEDIIEILIKLI